MKENKTAGEDTKEIAKKIGEPAVLELLAEKCAELTQAALKMARWQRNENPTPKTWTECRLNLEEGLADVTVCADLLYRSAEDTDVVDPGEILTIIDRKRARLKERMGAAENEKKSDCD